MNAPTAGRRLLAGAMLLAALSVACGRAAPAAGDAAFRTRDAALLADLEALSDSCAGRWSADAACLARLCDLRDREQALFADVRAHTFADITESNYWHRGRLKFPGEIARLLQQAAAARPDGGLPCPQ
jgi:hypothetical protein